MSARLSLLAALRDALRQLLARPHLVAALLLANLLTAWLLILPVSHLLGDTLDDNLYGETLRTGTSWRWYDTVERRHGPALGNLDAVGALFSDEGVGLGDLRRLAGPPAAVALAAVILFWLNGLLHCGFLAHLTADRRGGFAVAIARYAPAASTLAAGAGLLYAATYALLYVQLGKWLKPLAEGAASEWTALGLTWGRLGLTLAAWLAIKITYDLVRVVTVERDSWNLPWNTLLTFRELWHRGGRYTVLYLLLGLGTPLLALAWWGTAGHLVASGWLTLLLLFVLHQLLVGTRIALRLAHLAATRALYRQAQNLPTRAPYKVAAPPETPSATA